jgi:ribosomal protein S27AE
MFALKDILELLDRWPSWKKIQAAPERIESLEKRVGELEHRLARCPGEGCPKCGELTYRTISNHPVQAGGLGKFGVIARTMKCEKCGYTEAKTVMPK